MAKALISGVVTKVSLFTQNEPPRFVDMPVRCVSVYKGKSDLLINTSDLNDEAIAYITKHALDSQVEIVGLGSLTRVVFAPADGVVMGFGADVIP